MMDRPSGIVFETSMGPFAVELYWDHAPKACENLAGLAARGYYNDTTFHRVIKDFMAQCGDPTGTGRGGSSLWGGKFPDEITKKLKHTGAGVVSMANSGPNTNRSQFFITLAPAPWLDGKHTVFGRVSAGMRVVQRIGLCPTDGSDRPTHAIVIRSAQPYEGPPPDLSQRAQEADATALIEITTSQR